MKHLWIPKRYWQFVPNWNAIGLVSLFSVSIYLYIFTVLNVDDTQAFVAPQIPFSVAM